MVVVRSLNEIILSLIDYFKAAQPDLDTKPGTVARDLFIDAPASQISTLYGEINKISAQQSLRLVSGSELDRLASNFGLVRNSASYASGVALFTFSSLPATLQISSRETVTSSNGVSFKVANDVLVSSGSANTYRAVATKYRNDLDLLGIKDTYAIEITVQASSPGTSSNISKYSINSTSAYGVSNVTNILPFSGGNDTEDDSSFRTRVLAIFGGSSIGTALGYRGAALGVSGVADAYVVEPGDPLMKRDGTITSEDNNGNLTIVSEGSGNKVDVVVFGQNLVESTDSFIYQDKSNTNDPSDSKNNYVLGQITGDESKTINRRRIDNLKNGTLPSQPINTVSQVSGTLSGSNFQEKSIDEYGRVSGNYEIVKDTGFYGGSPFGFDTFKWISNKISLYGEDKIKGKSFGKDALTYTDVTSIPRLQQNISITNENSDVVPSDRSLIKLRHVPVINVSRVFNATTGERYTVVDQNYDPKDSTNKIGTVKISGNTLPAYNDVLQVDYTWIVDYDCFLDFDGKQSLVKSNKEDSVDWSYANTVRRERVRLESNTSGTLFVGKTTLPISSVISAIYVAELDAVVNKITDGPFAGRLAVSVSDPTVGSTAVDEEVSIDSICLKNTNTEVFKTAQGDGFFTNSSSLTGSGTTYTSTDELTVILPSDSLAKDGDILTLNINKDEVFTKSGVAGSFSSNEITIPLANLRSPMSIVDVYVSYIAESQDIMSGSVNSLPLSRSINSLISNGSPAYEDKLKNNVLKKEHKTVYQDILSDFYVDLSISPNDFALTQSNVVAIIRLSDEAELWSYDNQGSVVTDTTNSIFKLKINASSAPQVGDKVLVFYYANSSRNIQPVVYTNSLIQRSFDTVQNEGLFYVRCHAFESDSSVSFQIIDQNIDYLYLSGSNANLSVYTANENVANLTLDTSSISLPSFNFSSLTFAGKKIRILNSTKKNNNNLYDILDFNPTTKTFKISNNMSHVGANQVSITRISDGKELLSSVGNVDYSANRVSFSTNQSISVGDRVFVTFYKFNTTKNAPTRLAITATDQVSNPGVLSVKGTSIVKVSDAILPLKPINANVFRQDLSSIIKESLGLTSDKPIPPNVKLVNISKIERVSTISSSSSEVFSVNGSYDILGTRIKENSFYPEIFSQKETKDISYYEFILPQTSNNISNLNYEDKMRITFYYAIENDIESVPIQGNGTAYTNKKFAIVDSIYSSGGFRASASTKITASPVTQPAPGARYKVYYDYIAPKPNERIAIKYFYNRLISDVSLAVNKNRTINSDVLVREAKQVPIDLTMSVKVSSAYSGSSISVLQNVKNAMLSVINSTQLGSTIDYSAIVNAAFSVAGVANARVIIFNKSGNVGQKISIKAKSDEYFVANNIVVNRDYS